MQIVHFSDLFKWNTVFLLPQFNRNILCVITQSLSCCHIYLLLYQLNIPIPIFICNLIFICRLVIILFLVLEIIFCKLRHTMYFRKTRCILKQTQKFILISKTLKFRGVHMTMYLRSILVILHML